MLGRPRDSPRGWETARRHRTYQCAYAEKIGAVRKSTYADQSKKYRSAKKYFYVSLIQSPRLEFFNRLQDGGDDLVLGHGPNDFTFLEQVRTASTKRHA